MDSTILKQLQTCASPLCTEQFEQSGMRINPRRYCSERCRQDVWILKRAKQMVDHVGVISFHVILDKVPLRAKA
jgi:hypothetical protein